MAGGVDQIAALAAGGDRQLALGMAREDMAHDATPFGSGV